VTIEWAVSLYIRSRSRVHHVALLLLQQSRTDQSYTGSRWGHLLVAPVVLLQALHTETFKLVAICNLSDSCSQIVHNGTFKAVSKPNMSSLWPTWYAVCLTHRPPPPQAMKAVSWTVYQSQRPASSHLLPRPSRATSLCGRSQPPMTENKTVVSTPGPPTKQLHVLLKVFYLILLIVLNAWVVYYFVKKQQLFLVHVLYSLFFMSLN